MGHCSKTSVSGDLRRSGNCHMLPLRLLKIRLHERIWSAFLVWSVSYEDLAYWYFSKSHMSSLQNERFARDFLKNSHFKSAKQAFRITLLPKFTRQAAKTSIPYETSSNSQAGKPEAPSEHTHTHIKQPCQAVSRFQPLQTTPAHMPIPMSQRHSPPPHLATSRFPKLPFHTSKPA